VIPTRPPRLFDRAREAARVRHYSRRTETAYLSWIRRFIFFHGKRHPAEMSAPEVTKFLSSLAVEGNVAASAQNQALGALLFLYRDVLEQDLPWLDDMVRAKRPARLPVVLTREEVRTLLLHMAGVPRLMAMLIYGAGLRLLECARLRVKDVDFARNQLTVRGGKGDKDRMTMLPAVVKKELARHLSWPSGSTRPIFATARAGWSCRRPSHASIRTQAGNGPGSGCSRLPGSTSSAQGASAAATTCTNPCFSVPCGRPSGEPPSRSAPPAIPSATRSPRTCWRTATTSGRSKSFSGTGT
jgi:integrase